MVKKKIGILGGTFDPPHKGHLAISEFSIKKLKLHYVIWAITMRNPFKKKPLLSLNKRVLLSKKITRSYKKIRIKSYDRIIKSSETINLLNYLKKKERNTRYFFLMGADNLINFHRWKNWKKIAENCQITVYPRKGYVTKSLNSVAFRTLGKTGVLFLKSKMFNISSSKIRKNYLKYRY
tara:strand:+ start:131 stop:667 length:537 start_codon:yes stop_codon:yes gene_type:complete